MSRLFRSFSAIAIVLAGIAVISLALTTGAPSVRAAGRNGVLHIMKECSQDKGNAGDFCTITSSNLTEIPVGSKVFYDQAAGTPTGMLDSNVIVDAGNGNRGFGRCTLDLTTALGLCTFSDGTGLLTGFNARAEVDCTSVCQWVGAYRFSPNPL